MFADKFTGRVAGLLIASLCCSSWPAGAQTVAAPPAATRSTESTPAYRVDALFDGEFWRNARGEQPGRRFLDHGLASLTIDGASAFDLPSLKLYGSMRFGNGQSIDELIGSAQGISNIEALSGLRPYEAWLEWQYTERSSLKLGLYDVNSEFDVNVTGALFINPSQAIGPDFSQSGRNGPSIFPTTSLGLRSRHQHGPCAFLLAALDGVSGDPDHPSRNSVIFGSHDGLLLLAETACARDSTLRVTAGYWRYTAKFDDLNEANADGTPVQHSDNHGYYAMVNLPLRSAEHQTGVNTYVRVGKANAHINVIETYLGAGVVLSGLLPNKQDQLGLAIGIAVAGDPFRDAQQAQGLSTRRQERITELSYLAPITEWLSLQPDIQHVQHPGFNSDAETAWVFGLRFKLATSFSK